MADKHLATTSQSYGPEDAVKNIGRRTNTNNVEQEVQMKIVGSELGLVASVTGKEPAFRGAVIPSGAHIKSASIDVTTAFSGTSSNGTLTIGTWSLDGTVQDADGIDATVATSSVLDTIGTTVACDGADIDTVLSEAVRLGAYYATNSFDTGEATVTVKFIVP